MDTHLRFAEAVNRLDLAETRSAMGLPDFVGGGAEGGATSKVKGLAAGAKEALTQDEEKPKGRSRSRSR